MKPHSGRTRRNVVENVNAELGRRRVTQKQLAQWLGISQAAASERMNNKTPYTLDELDELADRFGIPVAALVSEVAYAVPAPAFRKPDTVDGAPIAQLAELRTFNP